MKNCKKLGNKRKKKIKMKLIIDSNNEIYNDKTLFNSSKSPYGLYIEKYLYPRKLIPIKSIENQLLPYINFILWKYTGSSKLKLKKILKMINNDNIDMAIIMFKAIFFKLEKSKKFKNNK